MIDAPAVPMRILIISHFFPPLNRMASSRPHSWATEFAARGQEVVVLTSRKDPSHGPLDLTVEEGGYERVEVPYPFGLPAGPRPGARGLVGKVLGRLGRLLWVAAAGAAIRGLRERRFDVVISTFGPTSMHGLGHLAAATWPGAVWAADYRDLWAGNPYARRSRVADALMRRVEQRVTGAADLILTVAEPLAEELRARFPTVPVEVVYNGFEGRAVEASHRARSGPAIVVYTGTIYAGKRDPSPLFRAVAELEREGRLRPGALRIDFYGDRLANLPELVERHGVQAWVRNAGPVSREQSLEAQRTASLLLFLELGPPEGGTELSGKIFEYLAAGTPILGVGSTADTAVGRLLAETGAGIAVGRDTARIRAILETLVAGVTPDGYAPRPAAIARYSRSAQAERCLELVRAAVPEPPLVASAGSGREG